MMRAMPHPAECDARVMGDIDLVAQPREGRLDHLAIIDIVIDHQNRRAHLIGSVSGKIDEEINARVR